jgi:hypothetical protein
MMSATTSRIRPLGYTAIALLALSGTACANLPLGLPIPTPGAPASSPFTNQPATAPTISSGRAGWPLLATDPNVYVDAEGYHLFYTTWFCQRERDWVYSWDPENPMTSCNIMKTITSIAYAFSSDRGLTWTFRQTPVVLPSDSGFDAGQVETATFFLRGNTAHIAYSADGSIRGRRLTGRYQIGVASLSLGRQSLRAAMMDETRRFERRATPLLPFDLRAGRFDNNVQEPSVVIGPDGIVLYYIGLGFRLPGEPTDATGQGITSVGLGRAVLDEHLNVLSRSASPVLEGVNITEVKYYDNAYQLFATTLSGGEAHRGETISHATSIDGVRWTAPRVIVSPGSTPGFNDWGVMAPTVAVDANGVVLFYTAFGTAEGPCQPLGPSGRWGLPLRNNSKCMFATTARAVSARVANRPGATK